MKAIGGKSIGKRRGAHGQAPAKAALRAMRAQGRRTRSAIIEVARVLLIKGGSLEFSLREVAAGAGIRTSNLQYYFPTKLALLRAVVEPVVDAYLEELTSVIDRNVPPAVTLEALARHALSEVKNAETAALWRQFVSFALIDAECSRVLDEWYESLTSRIALLIRAAYPQHSVADSLHRATLMIAVADGLHHQLGAGVRKRAHMRGFDATFLAAMDRLLRAGLPPGR